MSVFLANDNTVYSPVNIFFAIAMLAECTKGDTQKELLDLSGIEDLEALRECVENLYVSNNFATPSAKEEVANSIWLDQAKPYNQECLDALCQKHKASSYIGTMGTDEMDKALQDWLNKHTGNMLEESIKEIKLNEETIIALCSALYLKAGWATTFDGYLTSKEVFDTGSEKIEVDMMHCQQNLIMHMHDTFTAAELILQNLGKMYIFLPRGNDASLIQAEEMMQTLQEEGELKMVRISLPKMDVSCSGDVQGYIADLGVKKIFEGGDFSSLTDLDAYVSTINHGARFKCDEEGVEAAAYTEISVEESEAEMPVEVLEFNVDHPYRFILQGFDGSILMAGNIQNPQN
jgi:serine protease inhibitor